MNKKTKITKDTIPQNFTISLCLVDLIPVILFGISTMILGLRLKSILFFTGALICLLSGSIKVFWKIIVALKQKNVWPLFIQMRIAMPFGFLLIIIATIICFPNLNFSEIWNSIITLPSLIFYPLGILGMLLMSVFAFKLDASDIKSNWIEQITNSFAQLFILLGILL